MKKILWALMAVVVLGGCETGIAGLGRGGWTKDGMTSDQLQKDYWECKGPPYVKEGMTWEEYEKDFDTCSCKFSQVVPTSYAMPHTIKIIYAARSTHRCDLCMKEKGYKKVKWSPFSPEATPTRKKGLETEKLLRNCMKGKGYEWSK